VSFRERRVGKRTISPSKQWRERKGDDRQSDRPGWINLLRGTKGKLRMKKVPGREKGP